MPIIRQSVGMTDDAWRKRLEAAVAADGRSLRDISLEAGLSHGYLHGILRHGKEPTMDRFIKICQEIGISVTFALSGVHISPSAEKIIRALDEDQATRDAVLMILERRSGS